MNEGKDCVNFMESLSDSESPADFSALKKEAVSYKRYGKMILEKKMNWLIQPVQIYRSV